MWHNMIVIFLNNSCSVRCTTGHILIGKWNQGQKQISIPRSNSEEVSVMYQTESREIERMFYLAILCHIANGG